jgi:hypothetical protein
VRKFWYWPRPRSSRARSSAVHSRILCNSTQHDRRRWRHGVATRRAASLIADEKLQLSLYALRLAGDGTPQVAFACGGTAQFSAKRTTPAQSSSLLTRFRNLRLLQCSANSCEPPHPPDANLSCRCHGMPLA